MKWWLGLLASAAFAQPGLIDIGIPESILIAGFQTKVSGMVRGFDGAARPDAVIQWSSSDAAVLMRKVQEEAPTSDASLGGVECPP